MKTVSIAYDCMWAGFDLCPADYLIECFPCLRDHYRFELSTQPQVAFYSVYGYVQKRCDGATRVLYAGETGDHFAYGGKLAPGIEEPGFYHFGITCAANQSNPNHCYMPAGLLHLNLYKNGVSTLVRDGSPPPRKEYFCNFIYSNGQPQDRIVFYQKLSQYKRIESCGHVCHNNNALAGAPYCREGYLQKQAFQARCKFSIAMENSYFPGYSTEKLTDPFVARSVPIYKGDPRVVEWFNPKAFINLADFQTDEEAIEYIKAVDNDDALYSAFLNAPPFVDNLVPELLSEARYLEFWRRILG